MCELGSERRETVRSIFNAGIKALRGPFPSTPIKTVRELGSECHETIQSISSVGIRTLR